MKTNGAQFGPYRKYESGNYLIIYNGDNLDKGVYKVYDNKIEQSISITILKKVNNKVIIEVYIP